MAGFKEPQPRGGGQKPAAVQVPPQMMAPGSRPEAPIRNTPLMVIPDYSPFELRKAALEAACAIQGTSNDATLFWRNLGAFEEYLRDGTKPS